MYLCRSAPKQKYPWCLLLWGPLGKPPPQLETSYAGAPCKAPQGDRH